MIDLDQLDRARLDMFTNCMVDCWQQIATEQGLPLTSEGLAQWCAQRIALYTDGPLAKRSGAARLADAAVDIRRALGMSGVMIVAVPLEHDGVRSIVAEIRDAASCQVLDCSGRKRLGDVAGRTADERAIAEAQAICRVRGWDIAPPCSESA